MNNAGQDHNLDYLIIGGYAASYWGTPRFTGDIDFVVEDSAFKKVESVIVTIEYNLEYLHPKGSFAHFSPLSKDDFRVDFVIVNSSTWQKLYDNKHYANFGKDRTYPIISPIHFIAMKLHAAKQSDRTEYLKDLGDIVEIMINQDISFETLTNDGILENMELNLPSKNSQDYYDQEKQSPNLTTSATSSRTNISVIKMYDESYEWIKLDWVQKKLEARWKKDKLSSFEPFTL